MSESARHSHEETVLYTAPSFCIYADGEFGGEAQIAEIMREKIARTSAGENTESEFSFAENKMRKIEEDEDAEKSSSRFKDLKIEIGGEKVSSPINPAKGAGGDAAAINKLRSHAEYLKSIGDLHGAEECYLRAMEADPKDGEMMSQYAKLVWQLHGDQARASRYFEKAALAAPANSDVLAAQASFLWDIDENEDEEPLSHQTQVNENPTQVDSFGGDHREEMRPASPPLHLAMGLGINDAGFSGFVDGIGYMNSNTDDSTNVEEYYKRMVEENPRNASFLRDYALFLHQTKGDLHRAEEYYSRAIIEDPRDGQVLSLYAGILWQLHHDKDRAAAFFQQAVEASPGNSNVLAARAKFLWETEADEADMDEARRSSN